MLPVLTVCASPCVRAVLVDGETTGRATGYVDAVCGSNHNDVTHRRPSGNS
jgi:hypothetical protein